MTHGTDRRNNGDYSCEVLSLIVLFFLSALSHFWYILAAVAVGILLWVGVVLLGRLLVFATQSFFRHDTCLWSMMMGRSEARRRSPELCQNISPSIVDEPPASSFFYGTTAECEDMTGLCRESDPQNQVFQ